VENQKPHVPRGMGTVEACNLCVKRVDEGKLPACVDACKMAGHNAILFGDLRDKNSEISQRLQKVSSTALRADMGLNPGVRYENL
jgi:molybdopterin-containing oxidoreductase family iron-sulfur binding subunit